MIILSTGSLYNYGTERTMALAAEIGFDGIEIMIDDRWDTRQPAYLQRLSNRYDLPIAALHSPFVLNVQGWPPDQLGRLEHTIALAQELGVPLVVTHLPFRICGLFGQFHGLGYRRFRLPLPLPHREPYDSALRDGRIAEMEAQSGVIIAVENMPAHHLFGRRLQIYDLNEPAMLTRFPHLTLDTTHLGTWGMDPVAVYRQLREHVAHVHLSNFDGREHRSPPNGHLPLAELLQEMARAGYDGAISVESGPDALNAANEEACRQALAKALAFCRRYYSNPDR